LQPAAELSFDGGETTGEEAATGAELVSLLGGVTTVVWYVGGGAGMELFANGAAVEKMRVLEAGVSAGGVLTSEVEAAGVEVTGMDSAGAEEDSTVGGVATALEVALVEVDSLGGEGGEGGVYGLGGLQSKPIPCMPIWQSDFSPLYELPR
jgi:hypothetical protein